jgi:hypothetical protein
MSEHLFSLIKALDKGERRYFRTFAQRHVIGTQNHYERLFDALQEMEVYDEAALQARFAGEPCLQQWASFKSYLYKILRRSLRAYHEESSVVAEMQHLLHDLGILFEKAQMDACKRLLNKGLRLAIEQDAHLQVLEFVEWDRRLIKRLMPRNMVEELARVAETERHHLECLRIERLLSAYYDQVFCLTKQNNSSAIQKKLADLQAEVEALLVGVQLSFHARITWSAIQGLVAMQRGALEVASLQNHDAVLTWQARPLILNAHRERYLLTLVNYLNTIYQSQNDSQFQAALRIVRSGQALRGGMQRFVEIMSGNLELLHLMNAGRYEEAEQIVPVMGDIIKEEPEFLRPSQLITYSYNVCVLLFVRGRYRNAVEWLNRILDFPGHDIRIDIRNAAQMLALIVHYELGNDDLLEYLLAAAQRKYSQDKPHFQLASLVATHLKSAILSPTPQARQAALQRLVEAYHALPPEVAARELGHLEVGTWLKGK